MAWGATGYWTTDQEQLWHIAASGSTVWSPLISADVKERLGANIGGRPRSVKRRCLSDGLVCNTHHAAVSFEERSARSVPQNEEPQKQLEKFAANQLTNQQDP